MSDDILTTSRSDPRDERVTMADAAWDRDAGDRRDARDPLQDILRRRDQHPDRLVHAVRDEIIPRLLAARVRICGGSAVGALFRSGFGARHPTPRATEHQATSDECAIFCRIAP